jgi:hypothetical protein
LTYRFALPTLTLTALALAATTAAQAQQKKPTTTGSASRPASAPAVSTPAPAPQPAPVQAAPTPAPAPVVEKPAAAPPKRPKAEPQGEHVQFGLAGALAAPMSSLGKAFTAGYNAGLFIEGKPASLPVGLRADIQYTRFPGKTTGIDTAYSAIQFTGAAVYDFPNASGGKSPFFATGGLGLYRWTLNGSGQTDFGQNLGLGINLKTRFKPSVEGRFHFFNDVQYFTMAFGFRR